VRLRELAVYSASDTVGDVEREFLNEEFQQLTSEFDRIARTTRYGNKQMLTGSGEEFEFQVGAFKGPENIIKFRLDANTTASDAGIDGLGILDQDEALDTLESLDEAIVKVAGARAGFGAMQSRLNYTINALEVQHENLQTAISHIVDVDIAEEVAKLAQGQIVQEAATSVVAQANASARRALRLLEV
jgi:flagellin